MVRAALKNPYAVIAISLIVIILGVVSYQKMVVDIFPEINMPVVAVATFYKGMGPSEVEGAITLRLEQAFLQASYIDHIESRSLPGVSLIKIYFHSSYDVNAGLAEITSLTYANLRFLPQGIFPPIIIKFGAASLPIAVQTTSSDTMTEKEVRDLAYFNIRPQLGNVPGVAFPTTFGGTVRQVTVFLDPERMLARGISTHEIVNSVNMQSVLLPAGDVKIGDFDYNVYTNSMIKVVDQMNDIPIKMVNGVPLFLRDVGKAVDSTMIQTNVVRINGNRAVYLPILKQAGANTIAVIDGIKDILPKLINVPKDLTIKLLFDQSLYIRQAIKTLEHEGLLGGGLACLMVLLFLGSLRSTLIVAMAIPLSVTAAFIGLYFTGHSVNIMTLGGLALAVGRLVDDAIVVVENFHRHMEMGKSSSQAAADAVSEVALPMLIITITVFLVFLPIAFFTGVIKFLFVPLALAVAYAMMASYIVALTLAPVSMARLLRGHAQGGAPAVHQGRFAEFWNHLNVFDPFVERYVLLLRWCLAHKALVIATVTGIFVGSMLMAPLMATEFFPKVDAGSFILNVSAPEGTRIEKTEAIVAKIEGLIREAIPAAELDQIVSNVGLPQGWMVLYTPVNGPHQAFVLVSLKRDHEVRTDDIIMKLRQTFRRELQGLKFSFQTGGIVSDVINAGLPAPIDIKVSGPKMGDLAATANKVRDLVAAIHGTADVQVRQGMDYPEIHLDINRDKASYVGLNEYQIVTDLVTGLSSNVTLNPGYWIDPRTNNAYFVVTQFPEQILLEFEDFLNMPLVGTHVDQPMSVSAGGTTLRGSSLVLTQTPFPERPRLPGVTSTGGSPVLLRDLVDVVRKVGPETVDHFNLQRTMDVLVSVPGNDLGRIAGQIEQAVAKLEIPKDVVLTFKGEVDSMRAAISGFAGTLPLAMVLIYLVMVGLFRSWLDPFVVMFAVPLGFIGVIWMLLLTHTSVNVESMIGTLMMIGIVVSNSVLLVDFANNKLREGMPIEEAVVEAGRLRIRPIIMTSLATVIGLAPMALGIGEGSESNMPLARAVIGGLTVSTFMTLLFIPVLHAIARRRSAASLAETEGGVH